MKLLKYLWLAAFALCLTAVLSGAFHHLFTAAISLGMYVSEKEKPLKIKTNEQ